jgi:CDP-diacylglycerol pyrophosphatase
VNSKSIHLLGVAVASASLVAAAAAAAAPPGGRHAASQSAADSQPAAGRDALRQIVQTQCVVNWSQHHDPAPCERVFLADSKTDNSGYAVLADRKGGAH